MISKLQTDLLQSQPIHSVVAPAACTGSYCPQMAQTHVREFSQSCTPPPLRLPLPLPLAPPRPRLPPSPLPGLRLELYDGGEVGEEERRLFLSSLPIFIFILRLLSWLFITFEFSDGVITTLVSPGTRQADKRLMHWINSIYLEDSFLNLISD